jgi:hypothetical protein
MAQLNFNAAQVAPDTGRGDPLPAGWYIVAMEKSEMKPTSSGDGSSFLECVFGVLDGQFKGRKLFSRFNLNNRNPQAQEIAYKQFSAVCHAVGHLAVGDSAELHGRPLKVRVKIRPAAGDYEASNDITAYRNVNEPTDATPAGPAVNPMPPAAGVMPPPVQQQQWGAQPPAQQWGAQPPAPQGMPPAAPPQQQWAPQPAAPAPQAMPPASPPAWQPPAGAVQQPWAAAQQTAQPPAAPPQPPMPPANAPQSWAPPAAGVQNPAGATPPWGAQPQA